MVTAKQLGLGFTALILWVTASAQAAELSYTYIEADYAALEIDDTDNDGGGFRLAASAAVAEQVHVFGAFADYDLDGSTDREDFSLGLGLSTPLRPNTDLFGRLSYEDWDFDGRRGGGSRDGLGLRVGLRSLVNPQVELNGNLVHYALDGEDATGMGLGGVLSLTPSWGVATDFEFTDEETRFRLGARYFFSF
ncbi:MAG: hypothetical protein GWO02_23285 [Gammaproteobacteria bacterium]|nr:hypothetical protein [Gammaproteobacteria bacterium]